MHIVLLFSSYRWHCQTAELPEPDMLFLLYVSSRIRRELCDSAGSIEFFPGRSTGQPPSSATHSFFHCQVEILNILYCYAKCVVALSTGGAVAVLCWEMLPLHRTKPRFQSSTRVVNSLVFSIHCDFVWLGVCLIQYLRDSKLLRAPSERHALSCELKATT